jgi:thiamine-monophosphate kinase
MGRMREFDLLEHIFRHNQALPDHVTVPPGDDMGALRIGKQVVLVTVDQVADGVHVRAKNTPMELIARKAMLRNLSDVAAMAGRPLGAVAAACVPGQWSQTQARQLTDALHDAARRWQCPLIGGDLSTWDHPLLLSVTILAAPTNAGPILRSGALAGDGIYVTGRLGGAWDEQGGGAHLHAEPRTREAIALAETLGDRLHSMIDISDGLACDLGHICRLSRVSAAIRADAVPCREQATLNSALHDGEDYELCFTAAGDVPDRVGDVPVSRVGWLVAPGPADGAMLTVIEADGRRRPVETRGWEHGPSTGPAP